MNLERRRQKVAPVPVFLLRMSRYAFFAFLLIAVSVFAGTLGYRITCNLAWIDSFHMACMILTGMGPVVEVHTTTGKLFSSCYALYSGVAFLSITAIFFAPIIHRMLHILHVEESGNEN